MDYRDWHRPAFHANGDRAGDRAFLADCVRCAADEPVEHHQRMDHASQRRRSSHCVFLKHAWRLGRDGQPRRTQRRCSEPCGGGPEFARIDRGLMRTRRIQIHIGLRLADLTGHTRGLRLADAAVCGRRLTGLDLATFGSTQPLVVRPSACQRLRQQCVGRTHGAS